jgi:hypothetical protein
MLMNNSDLILLFKEGTNNKAAHTEDTSIPEV